jgi:tRNA (cmo5U34)-methyltransferase
MIVTPRQFVSLAGANNKDHLYQQIKDPTDFEFDATVVKIFPDMIGRSVPGYWEVTDRTALLVKNFYQPASTIYDLGTSLGALPWAILNCFNPEVPDIVAIDNSRPMIEQFKNNLAQTENANRIDVRLGDIVNCEISNASVVVLNYSLQFLAPNQRLSLLGKIYQALLPNGVLLLAEKIVMETEEENQQMRALHHEWKHLQGYSWEEINRKSDAISEVMLVDSLTTHRKRLQSVGFSTVLLWNQQYNFVGLVAQK